jgi:hypothetical protein
VCEAFVRARQRRIARVVHDKPSAVKLNCNCKVLNGSSLHNAVIFEFFFFFVVRICKKNCF